MFWRRSIIFLTVLCFILASFQESDARRREKSDEWGQAGTFTLMLVGNAVTGLVFHFIYNKISGKENEGADASPWAHDKQLHISGEVGQRFFLVGEDASKIKPGTPVGLSIRYRWRTGSWLSYAGLVYRTGGHDSKQEAEGVELKITRAAFTLGRDERSSRATFDCFFGAGVALTEIHGAEGTDHQAAGMTSMGTGLGFRVGKRFTLGPRIEFSNWKTSEGYYLWDERFLLSTDLLLEGTVDLF
jgi:hypothetical protein